MRKGSRLEQRDRSRQGWFVDVINVLPNAGPRSGVVFRYVPRALVRHHHKDVDRKSPHDFSQLVRELFAFLPAIVVGHLDS